MNRPLNKPELVIVLLMRVIGFSGLFAIPAILMPFSWMNAIHEFLGLGELPDAPIVSYLARSLSAFYGVISIITLLVSFDIRRYRSFLKVWAIIGTVMGVVLFGIDIASGMPLSWTLSEGPPTLAIGLILLWCQRHIEFEPPLTTKGNRND